MASRSAVTKLSNQFQCESPMPILQRLETQKMCKNNEKSDDIFFKSQVSLAETCQDQHTISRSFCEDITDEDSLSMDSKTVDDSSSQAEICQDFFLKGFCMNGMKCLSIHLTTSMQRPAHRNKKIRRWILAEMPQLLLANQKRVNSFLN